MIRVWHTRDKVVLFQSPIETGFVTSIAFTLDGNAVLAGTHEGECSVFDSRVIIKNFLGIFLNFHRLS